MIQVRSVHPAFRLGRDDEPIRQTPNASTPRLGTWGMGSDLLLTNCCLHLSHLLLEAFACGLLPHTCARNSQQQT